MLRPLAFAYLELLLALVVASEVKSCLISLRRLGKACVYGGTFLADLIALPWLFLSSMAS